MSVKRRSESVLDVAQDLELLCVKDEVTDMGRAKELREKRVAELRKSNGTLEMVSSYRSIEAKHTYLIKRKTCKTKTFIFHETKKPN